MSADSVTMSTMAPDNILGLVGRFTLDHTALLIEWARWARAEVERWPDVGTAEVSPEVVRAFEAAMAEAAPARAAAVGAGGGQDR